jgi:hypothetical protein
MWDPTASSAGEPNVEGLQMNGYNLTDRQKELLRKLVRLAKEGKLDEPIIPLFRDGRLCIDLRREGSLDLQGDGIGDLHALYDADLMNLRFSRKGTELYSIKQTGYDAVENEFEVPPPRAAAQYNIGAIIYAMSGGTIQAVGLADNAEISQVVNDPALLRSQVEALTGNLLDAVKSALTGNDLIEYAKTVQSFKEQLLAEEANPSLLRRLTSTLALLGDIEGTIGLMVRIWPYLYPLLLLAAERMR